MSTESLVEGDKALSAGHLLGLGELQGRDQFKHLFLGHGSLLRGRDDLIEADANVGGDRGEGSRLELSSRGRAGAQRQRH